MFYKNGSKLNKKSIISVFPYCAICKWDLSAIVNQGWVKKVVFASPKPTLYPVKLLRYWFMYNLLKDEQSRLGRPLRICEIGVDQGQMLRFTQDTGFREFSSWAAVDCRIQSQLQESGYSKKIEVDVDSQNFFLEDEYDVIIVLHILEHLFEPEELVTRLSDALAPGGILIGGFPVTPKWFAAFWQKRIRLTASKYGHVSVFSPQRVKKMAKNSKLNLDFLAGAFFLRKSGSFLENFKGWLHLNLLWGALFPSLGGEIYWQMSK